MVKSKPNVFLDLDNTIISAEAIEDFPFTKKDILHKLCKFTFYNMDGYYLVFERPHLQKHNQHLRDINICTPWVDPRITPDKQNHPKGSPGRPQTIQNNLYFRRSLLAPHQGPP